MVAPSSLSNSHAIWSDYFSDAGEVPAERELNFVMYNLEVAEEFVKEAIKDFKADYGEEGIEEATEDIVTDAINNSTEAAIRVRTPNPDYGNCNGAWEIIRSAATGGLGPTLYDLVMSISPQGITSDRSSVSNDARNVYSKYANQRGDVEKAFLDPVDLTVHEDDDCEQNHGTASNSSLWHLTRIMAVEYFRSEWPLEYETMEEQIDMDLLQDWGTMSGDEYFENVSNWIEENVDELDFDEWDIDDANDQWYDWKIENELDLINQKEGEFENPEFLNLSYNTDSSAGTFEDMQHNHWSFLEELRANTELDPENYFDTDGEGPSWSVQNFFKGHY